MGRVKGVIGGGLCAAVAIVFFQPWFGITVAAVFGVACIANLLLGAVVTLDTEAGVLGLRWGLIVRRVRLADVTAVLVEDSKLSIGRARGGEISIYLWGRGRLDRWLGLPVAAGDIGHAVAKASNAARSAAEAPAPTDTPVAVDAPGAVEAPVTSDAPVAATGGAAGTAGVAPRRRRGPRWPPCCSAASACSRSARRSWSGIPGTTRR